MTKTPKWLPDGSGIDPESLDVGTVVEWDGQVSRPPSQAVIEAVEQGMSTHTTRLPADWRGSYDDWMHAHVVEVARAAEAAALRAAAERMDDLSRGTPLAAAITARAAAIRLDHWADELTDETGEQ